MFGKTSATWAHWPACLGFGRTFWSLLPSVASQKRMLPELSREWLSRGLIPTLGFGTATVELTNEVAFIPRTGTSLNLQAITCSAFSKGGIMSIFPNKTRRPAVHIPSWLVISPRVQHLLCSLVWSPAKFGLTLRGRCFCRQIVGFLPDLNYDSPEPRSTGPVAGAHHLRWIQRERCATRPAF